MSWGQIIPYIKGIEFLIQDPEISDIMVNGSSTVYIEKFGCIEAVRGITITEKSLQVAVRNIARLLGDEICEEKPLLDARLPDGSRVAAVIPPCSVTGTILTIRKFHSHLYTSNELVRIGTLPMEALGLLQRAVEARQTILISGGTGTGKTTLLTALANFIDPEERVIVLEDTAEIQLTRDNLVRLEARREQPGLPAVTIRDLLRMSLRLRPDRILLGEVRGGEAFDLLQALNTGHAGTLCTIHANSAAQAISRFTTCVLQSNVELPYKAVRRNIAEALNLVIHIERRSGKRQVMQILQVERYDAAEDRYQFRTYFERDPS